MKKQIEAVEEFHSVFGHPVARDGAVNIPTKRYELRHNLMAEENEEYLEAARTGNKVEIADALGDMMYILSGTIIEHGMQNIIEDVFDEIQKSNMSKLGKDGNPVLREDGKILKGPEYFKPNVAQFITGQFYQVKSNEAKLWLSSMQNQLIPIAVMEDTLPRHEAVNQFALEVEEETKLKWTSIARNMNKIADLGDTLFYEFIDELIIKNEIGVYTLYKVAPEE